MFNRKAKDTISTFGITLAALIVSAFLVIIVGFIFRNGWGLISTDFLRNNYNEEVTILTVDVPAPGETGMVVALEDNQVVIQDIDGDSPFRYGVDNAGNVFPLGEGNIIEIANGERSPSDIMQILETETDLSIRARVPGGGVFPMIVSTLLLIGTTLIFAAPIGIFAAIYMTEYAKQGRLVNLIRFATEILAGIPSVVYGLFGLMMFVRAMQLGTSILAGAFTMTILLLPIMMRTTEEALKAVPRSYREASYALGANKIQTIGKVVLPSALPGIMVGLILSIGRIVGESAALIFTVGTFASLPMNAATGNLSVFETGATLTLRSFMAIREFADVEMASAIGIVILVIVFILNIISKIITKRLNKFNY